MLRDQYIRRRQVFYNKQRQMNEIVLRQVYHNNKQRQMNEKLLREQMVSSCTQRLLAIQRELQLRSKQIQYNMRRQQQNVRLQQQFVSSVVMKEQAQRRLLQQQCILIEYLKQQLYQLSASSVHYTELIKTIDSLQSEYMRLGEMKIVDQQQQQILTLNKKKQYEQLLQMLPHVTNQSTVKYQIKMKLKQRNSITQQLLVEKSLLYGQISGRYHQQKSINTKTIHQNKQKIESINKVKQQNQSLNNNYRSQQQQLQTNKNKIQQLQQQIKLYQESTNKLKHIKQAAQNDNTILKQQLQTKISNMKHNQTILKNINQQKLLKEKQKLTKTNQLNLLVKKNEIMKSKYQQLTINTQTLIQKLRQIQMDNQLTQQQLSSINMTIDKLTHLKQSNLQTIQQKHQLLLKQNYYIQQYLNINHQLIKQIQILIKEDQHKQSILKEQQNINKHILDINNKRINFGNISNVNKNNKNNRSLSRSIDHNNSQFIVSSKLRNILVVARQQLKSIQLAQNTYLYQLKYIQ